MAMCGHLVCSRTPLASSSGGSGTYINNLIHNSFNSRSSGVIIANGVWVSHVATLAMGPADELFTGVPKKTQFLISGEMLRKCKRGENMYFKR
jgi:hypothetical protein